MIERIRELSHDQIESLKQLGHDALAAISPPLASMVYSNNPDQISALQNIGPDALGAMSPQLAAMLYGDDGYGGSATGTYGDDGYGGSAVGPYGDDPDPIPPIILPPFPLPPGGGDDGGGGDYKPDPGDLVVWWAFDDACPVCLDNADDPPRPYGEPFSSGDTEPPSHDHCRCSLMSAMRGSHDCPVHSNRIFELSNMF